MSFIPSRQNKLIGFEKEFDELISLYKENNYPGKLLFKRKKGIGKCTMAYHLINYMNSKPIKESVISILDKLAHPWFFNRSDNPDQ